MLLKTKNCICLPIEDDLHERKNCSSIAREAFIACVMRIETLTTFHIILFIS